MKINLDLLYNKIKSQSFLNFTYFLLRFSNSRLYNFSQFHEYEYWVFKTFTCQCFHVTNLSCPHFTGFKTLPLTI